MTKEQEEKFLFDTAIEQRTKQGLKGTLDGFIAGVRWQAKRMYTEEEVFKLLNLHKGFVLNNPTGLGGYSESYYKEKLVAWFEKFKK